jgi:hypothetical protein
MGLLLSRLARLIAGKNKTGAAKPRFFMPPSVSQA